MYLTSRPQQSTSSQKSKYSSLYLTSRPRPVVQLLTEILIQFIVSNIQAPVVKLLTEILIQFNVSTIQTPVVQLLTEILKHFNTMNVYLYAHFFCCKNTCIIKTVTCHPYLPKKAQRRDNEEKNNFSWNSRQLLVRLSFDRRACSRTNESQSVTVILVALHFCLSFFFLSFFLSFFHSFFLLFFNFFF